MYLRFQNRDWTGEEIQFYSMGEDSIAALGTLQNERGESLSLAMHLGFGTGTSTFTLEGNVAVLRGELGSGTFRQAQYLRKFHPEIDTILFQEVPGSVNDEINVETGRLIRQAGYTTIVPEDGFIASGGVDLFAAGVRRIIHDGAQVGVHAWGDPFEDVVAQDLPRTHPAHRMQIQYFQEMLPNGPEFYFFTLQAAPFDDIHFMTRKEIQDWRLTTEP